MPQLFDVPGWSVPETSNTAKSDKAAKKRKRPTSDTSSKLLSAEFNLEKLMDKLKESTKPRQPEPAQVTNSKAWEKPPKKDKKKGKKSEQEKRPELARQISQPKPLQPKGKTPKDKGKPAEESPSRPTKRVKIVHPVEDQSQEAKKAKEDEHLTPLQRSMKQSLDGAKFRMINENLYKSDSQSALQMMQEDPTIYDEYHTGFRHQVHSWPTNPVEQYVSKLSDYPPRTVIADLGCGDAALARRLVPEGMSVLSFDLVSDGKYVVEADACKKLPLPGSEPSGSESSMGEGHIVDVTVCSLSLMSTNWPTCIREAWRVLKEDGELQIAEVASRFTSVKDFERLICSIGFRLITKDDSNSHFTLFDFKKVARKSFSEKEWSNILGKASVLKPCEYKRR